LASALVPLVLKEAQAKAAEFRALVDAGVDPGDKRRAEKLAVRERVANTFGEAADAMQEMTPGMVAPEVLAEATRLMRLAPLATSPQTLPRFGPLDFIYLYVGVPERVLDLPERNVAAGYPPIGMGIGLNTGEVIVGSIGHDAAKGKEGAREQAAMYLANKVQNIKGSADTLLDLAEIEMSELEAVATAMERGGRLAAKEQVTDSLLDRCKPIAGTPADCIAAIEEYRDAGCTHVMLELWGDRRHEQIELFGKEVLPHFR
jgi:alkanesulfonate monooxygenase SsuD/methylene tetrahydromethanopterin reductase-like flavin-dependent oxidoreductase (luciferase family)